MSKLTFLFLNLLILTSALGCRTSDAGKKPTAEKWYMELNSADVGLVRGFLHFEWGDSTFTAFTRKNADRDLLGFWTSTLGRWFTNDFKNGALINISHGKVQHRADTLLLSGIFQSALGNYYFNGMMSNGKLTATLTTRSKTVKGTITGSQHLPTLPLSNYPALIEQALNLRNDHIYNTAVLKSSKCRAFDKNIREVAGLVQDDLEMEFAFFYYAGKLPFSHFSLLRRDPEAEVAPSDVMKKQFSLEEKSTETAYLKVESFSGTAAEVDSVFSHILRKGYRRLIVDLRGNPGGSIEAGMQFARWVSDSSFYGGVFLTQKWFSKHSSPPLPRDYTLLPQFTESNFDLMIDGIHQQEGVYLKIIPIVNNYKEQLFILTDGITGSTCEPIVYGMKQRGRAMVVGQKTAGAMLTGEFFKLPDGFSIVIPTADYYAEDGYKIDRNGVSPSIEVKSAEALNYTLEQLIGK